MKAILDWFLASPERAVMAVAAAVVVAWKALPVTTRMALEGRYPRAAQAMRALTAIAPDLLKAAVAVLGVVRGTPKAQVPPAAPVIPLRPPTDGGAP